MADEETTETVDDTESTEQEESETDDVESMKAALKKANAEAAKYRKQAKSNEDAAQRLKQAEDADKSEQEKLNERASTAEKRAEDAEARAMRAEVAAAKGLTSAQAKRLVGSSQEELEQDADDLLESFGSKQEKQGQNRRTPKEKLRPGAAPDSEPEKSASDIADAVQKSTRGL